MSTPFELAERFGTGNVDPNKLTFNRKFFYSDAAVNLRNAPFANSAVDYDVQAIMGQIEMIIGTPIGTEENEPTFGSRVLEYQFDNITNSMLNSLELDALTSLKTWIGHRAHFTSISFTKDEDKGDLWMTIPFIARLTGKQYEFTTNVSEMVRNRG